jgi:hypothetical protein
MEGTTPSQELACIDRHLSRCERFITEQKTRVEKIGTGSRDYENSARLYVTLVASFDALVLLRALVQREVDEETRARRKRFAIGERD